MATTQYIGARYVPLFAEPIEWDKTKQYEPLTIVTANGNSYTSRQFVPTGIEITNDAFWALTGNYNAQIEQYRKEVTAYDGRITTAQNTADSAKDAATVAKTSADVATTAVATEKTRAETKESEIQSLAETNETDIAHLDAQMAATTGSELLTRITNETTNRTSEDAKLNTAIGAEAAAREAADSSLETSLTALVNGKFPVQASGIKDGAITAPKLAQSAIESVLQGFTVHRFDSSDPSADNDGLVVPSSNTVLAGLYIEELTLLIITRCSGSDAWPSNSNTIKLPDYVPSVTSNVNCGDFSYMVWSSSNNFVDWSSVFLYPNGYLRPKSNVTSSHVLPGSVIVYLRPYISNPVSTNATYSDLVTQNGVI